MEHYTKIKTEVNENEDDGDEMNGSQDISYEISYNDNQDGSYVEMQAAEPLETETVNTEGMNQIEIVPLSANGAEPEEGQTQIIIESVQGASQANIQPSANIASNVSVPKVVMIRGGATPSGITSQTEVTSNISNTQYTRSAPQSTNKMSTESILLQLAQTAQLQKPMPALPKLPAVESLQNIVTVSSSQELHDYAAVSVVPLSSMIPSVVQAEEGMEEEESVDMSAPLVQVTVTQAENEEEELGEETIHNL